MQRRILRHTIWKYLTRTRYDKVPVTKWPSSFLLLHTNCLSSFVNQKEEECSHRHHMEEAVGVANRLNMFIMRTGSDWFFISNRTKYQNHINPHPFSPSVDSSWARCGSIVGKNPSKSVHSPGQPVSFSFPILNNLPRLHWRRWSFRRTGVRPASAPSPPSRRGFWTSPISDWLRPAFCGVRTMRRSLSRSEEASRRSRWSQAKVSIADYQQQLPQPFFWVDSLWLRDAQPPAAYDKTLLWPLPFNLKQTQGWRRRKSDDRVQEEIFYFALPTLFTSTCHTQPLTDEDEEEEGLAKFNKFIQSQDERLLQLSGMVLLAGGRWPSRSGRYWLFAGWNFVFLFSHGR